MFENKLETELEGNRKKLLSTLFRVGKETRVLESRVLLEEFPELAIEGESFRERLGQVFTGKDQLMWLWIFGVYYTRLDSSNLGFMRRLLYLRQYGKVPIELCVGGGVTNERFCKHYQKEFSKIVFKV